jgi:hypothetical protein
MADVGDWDVEFYADKHGYEPCLEWMKQLSTQKRLALESAIELVLARRGLDVVETEYGKALGDGLYEFRLRWSASEVRHKVEGIATESAGMPEKIMLRIFFCTSGRHIILLLSGYDKARNTGGKRQDKEITKARQYLMAHREAARRRSKDARRS